MAAFLLGRLMQSLVLLVIVSIIGFTVLNMIPGGPLAQYALDPGMTQEDMARIKEQLGLNRPVWTQYIDWAGRLLLGDWGTSFRDGSPVLSVISRHVPATLLLMGSSTVIQWPWAHGLVSAVLRIAIRPLITWRLSVR